MTTPPNPDLAARVAQIIADIWTKDGSELNHVRLSGTLVACPRCKAWPGMACETSGGRQLLSGVHAGRRDTIARMSLDEKLAAYAGRKAGQEQAPRRGGGGAGPVLRRPGEGRRAARRLGGAAPGVG